MAKMIDCTHLKDLSAETVRASLPDPASYVDETVQLRVTLSDGSVGTLEFFRLNKPDGRSKKGSGARTRRWQWIPIEIPDELLRLGGDQN